MTKIAQPWIPGQNQDAEIGSLRADHGQRVDAALPRHGQIKHQDVQLGELAHEIDCFAARHRRSDAELRHETIAPQNPDMRRASDFPAALRIRAARAHYSAGATVFHVGSPTHSVFFVETGAVRLMRYGRAGEEVVLHDASAGEFFAEASLDSARYHCDAVAIAPTDLLQVPAAALRDLLDSNKEFAREWVALLARQLRAVRSRVERLSLKSAAERVRHLLVSEGRGPRCAIVVRGTIKDLARQLGLTHEVLYRTLATMEREGVIERNEGALRLTK